MSKKKNDVMKTKEVVSAVKGLGKREKITVAECEKWFDIIRRARILGVLIPTGCEVHFTDDAYNHLLTFVEAFEDLVEFARRCEADEKYPDCTNEEFFNDMRRSLGKVKHLRKRIEELRVLAWDNLNGYYWEERDILKDALTECESAVYEFDDEFSRSVPKKFVISDISNIELCELDFNEYSTVS